MDESLTRRNALVDDLEKNKYVTRADVAAALRATPRHFFLPDVALDEAYADRAIVTKLQDGIPVSSCSQPAIIAVMLEQLDLREGDKVLEIGAGTGYNATLMGYLVGAQGSVTTLDIDEDIVTRARQNLARADVTNVGVVHADGGLGYPADAPYDAVIATVGVWDLSPHWIEQLATDGKLVAPLWFHTLQFSIAFVKTDEGSLKSRSIRPCGFMRLRGAFAGPETYREVDGITVGLEDSSQLDVEGLRRLLATPPRDHSLPELLPPENRGLIDYLALQQEALISLADHERQKLDCEYAFGFLDGANSMSLLALDPRDWRQLTPIVRVYGEESAFLRLKQLAEEWEAHGRPRLEQATIIAAPVGSSLAAGQIVIRKKWMEYQVIFDL